MILLTCLGYEMTIIFWSDFSATNINDHCTISPFIEKLEVNFFGK